MIDEKTTWGQVYQTLGPDERTCITDTLDTGEIFPILVLNDRSPEWEEDLFMCLEPATVKDILGQSFELVFAQMGIPLAEGCLQDWLVDADIDINDLLGDEGGPELEAQLGLAMFRCSPDFFLDLFLETMLAGSGLSIDITETDRECVRGWVEGADFLALMMAGGELDTEEFAPYFLGLFKCLPDLFIAGLLSEAPPGTEVTQEQRDCIIEWMSAADWTTLLTGAEDTDSLAEFGMLAPQLVACASHIFVPPPVPPTPAAVPPTTTAVLPEPTSAVEETEESPEVVGDRNALIALYNATDGDNWENNTNWLSDKPLDQWYGVTTNRDGRVVNLVFWEGNWLSGQLPSELGSLNSLEELNLSHNDLTGEIPPELADLTNLKVLVLSWTLLTGEIPPELADLTNLKVLDLKLTSLAGEIPPELGGLISLEELDLSQSGFSGEIPGELGNLTGLLWLNLGYNELAGEIPSELGNLSNLEWLGLGGNRLSGMVPAWLGGLIWLENLYLGENRLSGKIPEELGALIKLGHLNLSANRLSGGIPPELGSLSSLEGLYLSNNLLSGDLPAELGRLTNLKWLEINGNQLTGCVPGSLQDGLTLEHSDLGGLPFC